MRLHAAPSTHLQHAYAPDRRKTLRLFPATETAELLGVTGQFLRKRHGDGTLPEPAEVRNGLHFYPGDEILTKRRMLQATLRTPGKYLLGRRDGDKLQVVQLMNFKGGSAKSTAAIHLCHYLALQG
ncbi:MAG: hypothetical protein AAFV31_14810 [Pseudomonadota bacterium]